MFLPEWLLTVQQQAAQPASSPTLILSKPVFTWGQNYNGSLGLGDTIVRSSPVQIGTSSWIMVGAGYSTTVGVLATGALFTWGSAAAGALGNGTTTGDRSSPIAIGASTWNYVAAGSGTNYAIRTDGGLFVWGAALSGKHGLNDNTNRNSPVQIGSSSWIQVSSRNQTTAAITVDKRLFAWGLGPLGTGNTLTTNRSSPVQVITIGTSSWTQVSVGEGGSLAISAQGIGYFWGTPATTNATIPTMYGYTNALYPNPLRTFVSETDETNYLTATGKVGLSWLQADINAYAGIALRSDRKIFTWGSNTDGALGVNNSTADQRYQPQIITPESTYNFVASGNFSGGRFFAIGTDGKLYAWGNNSQGALGVGGDSLRRNTPTAVNVTSSFVFVASGIQNSAAIATDGSLFTWGVASNGALGNGVTTPALNGTPIKIGTSSWHQVKVGQNFMIGITAAFKLFAWGLNNTGQLGDGTVTQRLSPVAIGSSSWIFIAAGQSQSFAIRSDNTLWSWGMNINGSLGLGDTLNRSSPVQISSPANWKWVDANNASFNLPAGSTSFDRTMGIASDNTLYAWGAVTVGLQLGTTQVNRSTPVQISTSAYSSVAVGACFAVAVRTNGVQYFWGTTDGTGYNPIYATTTTTEFSRLEFVPANFESWRNVGAGISHSAAIRDDYKLFVWGTDVWGQIGTGSSNFFASFPVQIGSSSWTQVACGHNTSYAIDTRNRLFTWGSGNDGERGNNSVFSASSPVQLGSSSWTMISAARSYVMALRN